MGDERRAIGVAIGTVGIDAPTWLRLADRIAELPVDRVWIWDHLIGRGERPRPALEALALAAAALARNEKIRIGTLVLGVTRRHCAAVASWAATVASYAPGRLTLGFGAGGDAQEHRRLGIPFPTAERRSALLGETLTTVRALLEGESGMRRPDPPIELLVAGDREESIAIAARAADAWVAPVATFSRSLASLRRAEAQFGRSPRSVRAMVLQELGAREVLRESPFGNDPVGWWSAHRADGADGGIVTVRSEEDAEALGPLLGHLR